ncbi:MAG: hypothetical protein ISP92_06995 [Pseudomonadales bacterium]|jgi:acetyl-CoA carboxylase biotin carboxyl carrier protein|nr:hypothetical protein [Pseudomonadales bacterium]MDA0760994.1 hypothetical protein [Pseudomonadota bacterium]MDA0956668.1 hypothetical protein [Pseudomonadota bacterium]
MDIRKVKNLIEMIQGSDISEIEIKEGEDVLKIVRRPLEPVLSAELAVSAATPRPRMQAYAGMSNDPGHVLAPVSGVLKWGVDSPSGYPSKLGDVVQPGDSLGWVETSNERVPIVSEVQGVLTKGWVSTGSRVKQGERIFEVTC